jgi:predicted DCC family thiol-disulfide oxidoreductase YuxK
LNFVNAVIPKRTTEAAQGWVLYDGECPLCLNTVAQFGSLLRRHHFDLAPLQTTWVQNRLGLKIGEPLVEMKLLAGDETIYGGAEALMQIARRIWWAWPLFALAQIPGAMILLSAIYRWIAANRHCLNGSCRIPLRKKWLDWLPLAMLPAAALTMQPQLAPWVFMCVLALAIFFGCKWLVWRRACADGNRRFGVRSLAFLFAWPGMDANKFLTSRATAVSSLAIWIFAATKTIFGGALFWFAANNTFHFAPLLTGWLGIIGGIIFVHFGCFHLLALAWRSAGVAADPVMRAPLLARSLADFWGARWNTAFNVLVHNLAFRPLARRAGVAWATLGVFLISGVIHDLVISLPARGGFGLPTGYFVLQGAGVLIERSRIGRTLGLDGGVRGRLFMFVFTLGPAYWLFHPIFVRNVILPMLQAIGAT